MKFVLDKLTKTKKNMVIWYDANEKLEKSFLSEKKVNKCKITDLHAKRKKKTFRKKDKFYIIWSLSNTLVFQNWCVLNGWSWVKSTD